MENEQISKREQQELNRKDKLNMILRLINEEGLTQTEAADKLGYKSGDAIGKVLKRAGYIRVDKKYRLREDEVDQSKTIDNQSKSMKNRVEVDFILDKINEISNRLEKLEGSNSKGIAISNKEMSYKSTSLRVDSDILAEFDALCDSFTNLSKSYLTSLALQEFVDKYGNKKQD